jgi:serine/threonine protein kinase/formylglycine-generating enzyme required for sulfatase activity
VLCYRCGGHVKDGSDKCLGCGQGFDPGLKAGPAAGFGAGIKRPRHAIDGAPCAAGDLIAGRYQLKEHAGSGPLGWLYRATEVSTDAVVALKILSPRFLQMPEEKRVFVEELHKAQRLAHPNIARIYEAGDDNGRPFIASQHLEGLTLRRIMDLRRQKGQRFTLQEVEPIVAQIAAALEAAGSAFAHGNLKADNVIVLPDLLKLTDFGLAVSLPRAPFMAAQKAAGVHRYLAPEFLLGEPLDARTDVFSLGVMLAEMLGGAQYDAQFSLIDKNPALPEAVEALVRRAASPRPGARFATAAAMAAELSELVAQVPRPAPLPRPVAEDAGDVVIVEAYTDPRLRIARALGATRAPPVDPSQPAALPLHREAPRTAPDPPRAEAPLKPAPVEPAAIAALSSLPLPVPFSPPPYEPHFAAPAPHAIEPPIAPVAELAAEELAQVAASVGATPQLLTAETAVRPAASDPESSESADVKDRPRRGVGRRGKEKLGKGRRRALPQGAAATGSSDPAWTSSASPTEGALAIGPTTPALERIEPDVRRIETPARVAPIARIDSPAKPVKPVSRPSSAPSSFAALEEQQPSRAPLYAMGAVALIVLVGGGLSVLSSRSADAKPAEVAAAEPAKDAAKADASKAEPAKVVAAKSEPEKTEPPKQIVTPSRRDGAAHHSMRDQIRAVRERVEKALADRKRQQEETLAVAKAKRAAEKAAAAEETFAPAVIRAPAPAPAPAAARAAAVSQPAAPAAAPAKPPPPAGAITGLSDADPMVSKDHGRLVVAAIPAAYAPTGAVKELACPPGMQKVPGGTAAIGSDASDDLRNFGDRPLTRVELKPYCIDQYEFPNQPGKLPKVAAPFAEAAALCKNAGKRLCSEEEWEAACRGPENLRFPYGTRFDPDACNTTDAKDNPRKTNTSGAFSRCKSGYNVFDLSGNAAEWTTSDFDSTGVAGKAVKGGSASRPGFDDRCASRRKVAPGAHAINVGFRCCADGM